MKPGPNAPSRAARPLGGFTLIEMVMTLALVGVLAMTAAPLYEVVGTRLKEAELRQALRSIRTALDAYKAASDDGTIPKATGESGFPASLEILVQGVEVNIPNAVAANGQPTTKRLMFLRQIPRDPFAADPELPAAQTWRLRAYGSPSDNPQPGADVYDVASISTRTGLDGRPYSAW